ncbi:hypothetical protein GQ457_08G020110 [Hibiscus cannabinus]
MELKEWTLVNLTDARKFVANHIDCDILLDPFSEIFGYEGMILFFNGYCGRYESITQASLRLQQVCVQNIGVVVRSSDAGQSVSRQGIRWQKPPVGWWKLNSDGATALVQGYLVVAVLFGMKMENGWLFSFG